MDPMGRLPILISKTQDFLSESRLFPAPQFSDFTLSETYATKEKMPISNDAPSHKSIDLSHDLVQGADSYEEIVGSQSVMNRRHPENYRSNYANSDFSSFSAERFSSFEEWPPIGPQETTAEFSVDRNAFKTKPFASIQADSEKSKEDKIQANNLGQLEVQGKKQFHRF
jgi:hypothetical protein